MWGQRPHGFTLAQGVGTASPRFYVGAGVWGQRPHGFTLAQGVGRSPAVLNKINCKWDQSLSSYIIYNFWRFFMDMNTNTNEFDTKVKSAETFLALGEFQTAWNIFSEIAKEHPYSYRGWWGMFECGTCNFQKLIDTNTAQSYYERAIAVANEAEREIIDINYNSYLQLQDMNDHTVHELQRIDREISVLLMERAKHAKGCGCAIGLLSLPAFGGLFMLFFGYRTATTGGIIGIGSALPVLAFFIVPVVLLIIAVVTHISRKNKVASIDMRVAELKARAMALRNYAGN